MGSMFGVTVLGRSWITLNGVLVMYQNLAFIMLILKTRNELAPKSDQQIGELIMADG